MGAEIKVLPYLPHLDGIRALALIGVLGFHFHVPYFGGGFVGVDVFLVLSGFLMTRIISTALISGTFKLTEFYISRFWRLFPSVIVTVAGSLLYSFILFRPPLALNVCKSALAAIFSGSNAYFYSVSGYFDTSANVKPLLHTWSLSMEEQFYLVWPPALILFTKTFKSGRWGIFASCIMGLCLASVIFNTTRGARRSEGFDFFLLPARLFEFGVGGLVHAFSQMPNLPLYLSLSTHPQGDSKMTGVSKSKMAPFLTELSACTGLGLIIWSYMNLPPASPVFLSLPAVIGAAMLIMAPTAYVNRFMLGNVFSRSFGKLAYAVYLTHWPIYVLFRSVSRAMRVQLLENPLVLLIASTSVGLGLHFLVERRFRLKKGDRVSPMKCLSVSLVTLATMAAAWSGLTTEGWSFRGKGTKTAVPELYTTPRESMSYVVKQHAGGATKMAVVGKSLDMEHYRKNFSQSEFNIIVVGNSFVSALIPSYYKAHNEKEVPFLLNWKSGCPLNPPPAPLKKNAPWDCTRGTAAIWQNIRNMPPNSTVVLTNNWGAYGGHYSTGATQVRYLSQAVKNLGHNPIVFGAAAGITNTEEFNACMDLLYVLEYLKLASGITKARCSDLVHPRKSFMKAEKDISLDVGTGNVTYRYISSIQNMCAVDKTSGDYKCPSTISLGGQTKSFYARDGAHLSFVGSVEHTEVVKSMVRSINRRRVK